METMDKGNTRVLVTGASGYVGIHCIKQLLQEGYQTRGTVRSSSNEMKIAPLIQLEGSEKLELVEADLCKDIGWTEAVKDCTYILHVASPFPLGADEMVIQTAVDGTLRVLKAAAKQPSVKKVVLTSSSAAINEGHDADQNRMFDENDWTNLESNTVMNYTKSKTLAEKAAWDFMKQQPGLNFKLTTINPTLIVGPLLHNVQGTSITVIRRFLNNEMPMVPALEMGLVDVRDVASAHIRAMTTQESDGERILVTAQPSMTFLEIANCLRKVFGPQGYTLPRYEAPYCLLWLYSCFDKEANEGRMRVGRRVLFDNSKAKKLLNMDFIDPHKSLVEMSYDIIDRGMVKKSPKYTGRQAEMA